jgi:hypothetical protein
MWFIILFCAVCVIGCCLLCQRSSNDDDDDTKQLNLSNILGTRHNKWALIIYNLILTLCDPDFAPLFEVSCVWCMLHVCVAYSVVDVGFWKVMDLTTACCLSDATIHYHQRCCEFGLTLWNTLYRPKLTLSELSHGGCSCDVVWLPFRFHSDQ